MTALNAPLPQPDRSPARDEFVAGLVAILPAMIAAAPIGLLYGALAAQKGLSPLEVFLTSTLVFAGSCQFVALELWTEPADWIGLGFAALLVNSRHLLLGASLSTKLGLFPRWVIPFAAFPMADENWAMAERRAATAPLTPAYYAGLSALFYCGWVLWTTLGSLVGAVVRDPATYGFDFVFTAMFIALLAGFWKGSRTGVVLAASGLVATLAKLTLPGAWYVLAGALAGIAAAALMFDPATDGEAA